MSVTAEGAVENGKGLWRYQDVEFLAEVISRGTAADDHGLKKTAYAEAEAPVCLIADPCQRRCHVCTNPRGDDCATGTKAGFGDEADLTSTAVGLTLKTDEFPTDQPRTQRSWAFPAGSFG